MILRPVSQGGETVDVSQTRFARTSRYIKERALAGGYAREEAGSTGEDVQACQHHFKAACEQLLASGEFEAVGPKD